MMDAFWWIGVLVVAVAALALTAVVLLWLYANLLRRRFEVILFRPSHRRMSIAAWHATKLARLDGEQRNDDWPADDWPINERPFYLSYQVRQRRYFIMVGWLAPLRSTPIKGKHPTACALPTSKGRE